VAKAAYVRDSAIGLLLTREFRGDGVRVLMGTRAAFAIGAGLGLALGLFTSLRRRR